MPTDGNVLPLPPGLRVRGRTMQWGVRTYVMGILNVTPDSFSGDGLASDLDAAVARGIQLAEAGCDIIDIGGESTRPGAEPVPASVELERVLPVIRALRAEIDAPISIDTYKAEVAEAALAAGADMVNDVWGLQRDPSLANVVARWRVPVVLMDNQSHRAMVAAREGIGSFYQCDASGDVVCAVAARLKSLALSAQNSGIAKERIILDPGIGFGKSPEQNLALIDRLAEIRALGYPVLCGPSRKSFIGLALGLGPSERLEGTAAAVAVAIVRGADIVRVHDVPAMLHVARMTDAIVRRNASVPEAGQV